MQYPTSIKIVVIGEERSAIQTWTKRLEAAGFSCEHWNPSSKTVRPEFLDVAIFLPQAEANRNELAAFLRSARANVKIIFLYDGTIRRTELADAVIHVNCEEADILRTLRYVMHQQVSSEGAN